MSRAGAVDSWGENTGREDLLSSVLESVKDLVWCTSVDGTRLLYLNSAAKAIYERPLDALISNPNMWLEAIHPEDRGAVEERLRDLIDQGEIENEYRIIRPDESLRWLQDRISVVRNERGEPIFIAGIAKDITDHKLSQIRVLESEALYHSLVENLPLNVIRKDRSGRIDFANRRYCQEMKKELSALIGITDFDLFPAQLAKKYVADDRRVLETGEVLHDIEEHVSQDGDTMFVEVFKSPVRNAESAIIGVQVMYWDVTDRKQTEIALDFERFLLHSLLDNIPDSIYFKDIDSRFTRVSRGLAAKFQLSSPDDAIGKSDADFFTEEHAQQALADEQELMRTGEPILGKVERETWKGQEATWCSTTKLPLHDREGRVVGTFGISRDVTEQIRAETELERERDLLKTIINNVPDIIFVKDRAGRFVTANDALIGALGANKLEGLIGKTDYDFSPPELACNYVADDQQVMRTGEPLLDQEEEATNRDGEVIWQLTTKVPLRDAEGRVVGLVGIGRNITRRKHAQEEIEEARELADAANRAKSDFLANMSHEIRTPLNAIVGVTELLDDTRLNQSQCEYLTMIKDSGDALLGVINDILDFSKIEAGKLDLEKSVFELRDNVGDIMRTLAIRAHSKQLELAFRVESEVPDILIADIGRLRQIVINLVGNAIKFTESGEILVDISCPSRTADEATLKFVVRDTGIGIPRAKLDLIFQEFEQADSSTTRRYGGTGLGLAISSRLVGLMDGRIWLESELGRGSQFHFTARMGVAKDHRPKQATAELVVVGGTPVLVVDDNATNRRILDEMLSNWGMDPLLVGSAADGLEALDRAVANDRPYQLIISDVNMPDVDGFEMAARIRSNEAHARTPIIMLTSGGRPGDQLRRDQLEIAASLMKPAKQSELFDAIVDALGENACQRPAARADEDPSSSRPLRILLAEDNAINQRLARAMLEMQQHDVTIASNGRQALEALEALDKGGFDVVLMDIQMPELDGLDATREIRRREQTTGEHVPIIAMTAHAMKGDRERCLESGMDEYVSKPIRMKELNHRLSQLGMAIPENAAPVEVGVETGDLDPVDWQAALSLAGGNHEQLLQSVTIFIELAPAQMSEVRNAVGIGDVRQINDTAHKLKGGTLFLACERLVSAAEVLETAGEQGLLDGIAEQLGTLEHEFDQVLTELTSWVAQHGENPVKPD
jgi:PAS domain S-box-containing protein